jgi:hypothetical protein
MWALKYSMVCEFNFENHCIELEWTIPNLGHVPLVVEEECCHYGCMHKWVDQFGGHKANFALWLPLQCPCCFIDLEFY